MKYLLSTLLLTASAVLSAGDLFKPSPDTINKMKADPVCEVFMRKAEEALRAKPIDPNGVYGTGKGRDVGFWPRAVGIPLIDWMEKLGSAYWITGDRKYAEHGVTLLLQTARDFPVNHPNIQLGMAGARGHITYGMALGCLYFGDLMTAEEKNLLADVLGGYIDDCIKYFDDPGADFYLTANHTALNGAPAGIAALYFKDRPGFPERLTKITGLLKGWLNHAFDDKGLYLEGYGYARYGMTPRLLIFSWMLREAGGEDLFKNPHFAQMPYALVEKLIPGTRLFDTRGDNDYTSAGLECLFLAVANQDPAAMWLWRNSDQRLFRLFPLYHQIEAQGAPEPELDLSRYPKSEFFPVREFALWRSGWSDKDVLFSIESGPAVRNPSGKITGHGQSDRGSYALYAFGELWLPDSGYANDPAAPGSRSNSSAHNLILVDGKMADYSDSPLYGYSRSDLTKAYNINDKSVPGPGAERVIRQTVFARPSHGIGAYAIVLDDFRKDGETHDFSYINLVPIDKSIELRPGGATLKTLPPPELCIVTPEGRSDGRAEWTFEVPEGGDYTLWAQLRSGSISRPMTNLVWLSVNGGERHTFDGGGTPECTWLRLTRPESPEALAPSPPVAIPFKLRTGRNVLAAATNEKGVELYALYLAKDGSAPFAPSERGIRLTPDQAVISGGMRLVKKELSPENDARLELFLFADSPEPVRMSQEVYSPPNPRLPLAMQRIRGEVRAVNPYFAAVLLPLEASVKTPDVKIDRRPKQVTVTVNWPSALDTITWPIRPDGSTGKAFFERQAKK